MSHPRLCAVCHANATYAIAEDKNASRVTTDAKVVRFMHATTTYYCNDHVPTLDVQP